MSAALCALHEVIRVQPQPYKNLIPSFISILKQVAEHRLPKAYDYHRTPAPFIQVPLRPGRVGACPVAAPCTRARSCMQLPSSPIPRGAWTA